MVPLLNPTGSGHRRVTVEDGVSDGEVVGVGGVVDTAPIEAHMYMRVKSNAGFVFVLAPISLILPNMYRAGRPIIR